MSLVKEARTGDGGRHEALVVLLRTAVDGFDAVTPREIASRDRFLLELNRLVDPFDQDADPVHVTGSAIVVGSRGTVLHLHKRIGVWMQPGGHLEPGEAPWEAALRETWEETGLPVCHPEGGERLVHLDAHPAGAHFHLDLRYLLLSDDIDPAPPPARVSTFGGLHLLRPSSLPTKLSWTASTASSSTVFPDEVDSSAASKLEM